MANAVIVTQQGPHTTQQNSDIINLTATIGHASDELQNENTRVRSSDVTMLRWQPPAHGRVKCNVDASLSNQLNRTGIGICIHDEEGTFVLAKSIHISPMCSVTAGEV